MGRVASVSPEEFVRLWQSAESVGEAAERMGMKEVSARQRAMFFRRNGVPLKKFPRGRVGPDWAALAALAEECLDNGEAPRRKGK